ncbi:hypothetical protein CRG98_000640 [Punica granatum]|uniref:Reverse transcriptase Ty1/copia-type domain-containing protein n=1 Tax=Punica granatum TaxID=22663 RepID=A0A2I0LEA9_PUNGR|nr:hypothetical protein CRG98_000640 [Punica granatum]
MEKEFEMTDLGLMRYFLGIEVQQGEDGVFISQERYTKEILKKFSMEDCLPVDTPVECDIRLTKEGEGKPMSPTYYKSLVGCLRYLTCTRPDILFEVGLVSSFMETPKTSHLKAAKRILKYVKRTVDYGLLLYSSKGEYIDAASCVCHAIWLRRLLQEPKLQQEGATKIYVDNKSAIALAKNPVHHERSKHIDTQFHFIREHVKAKEVELLHVNSNNQVADILTKALKAEVFQQLRR